MPEAKMPDTTTPANAARESTIDQAVAVRDALREALTKTNLLVHSLKRQRRQSKLVETTLQSLKQLQAAG